MVVRKWCALFLACFLTIYCDHPTPHFCHQFRNIKRIIITNLAIAIKGFIG